MSERLQILAFSFFPAFVPPNNGGVERLYNVYSGLAQYHDVTLISSSFLEGEREVIRHLPSFTEVRIPKDNRFASAYAELSKSSGAGDISGPALGLASEHFGALHDEYLAHYTQTDVIIHDSPFLINCDIFRGFDAKPRIYNSYNCETDLYSSFHAVKGQANSIGDLVRDLEAELCRHCDLITVCSNEDAGAFERHFSPAVPITILPNGYTPGPRLPDGARDPKCVVFVGSAHKPNVDAVRLIVDDIAPKMRNVQFHLIGSCHPAGKARNVIAHGVISQHDKEHLLRRASAAINPMKSGGGSSLKVADIASNGCPLLSTDLGTRGFGLDPNVHYISLDGDGAVDTISKALNDVDLLGRVAGNALVHFEQHFSWPKIVAGFVKQVEALASRPLVARKTTLVLNDYDSLDALGGGATRTKGLCRGMAETAPVVFLAFANDGEPRRRLSDDGRILSLLVDKSPQHLAEHDLHNTLHWVSTADIVSYRHAPHNERMMALFRCAASCSSTVICEHPYMVGVPRAFSVDFVYSSQNFEANLKAEGLRDHPLKERLLPVVREAESFACSASSFIVAVSAADATDFSANYRSTSPIMVVPNGADGPDIADGGGKVANTSASKRPIVIFMGSTHGPNSEAARWIVSDLAASFPDYDFNFVGAIGESLTGPMPANINLIGVVSSQEKTRHLHEAHVALNPMMSGSGSNVKLADYLQHGLPVLTTAFGARGYEWVPQGDAVVAELDEFAHELRTLIDLAPSHEKARQSRRAKYGTTLSMDAGGRRLAQLIDEHSGTRKRALYVTYRYNDPARGGGEEYVGRLAHALAASGWEVDVVSPSAERIVDVNRFSAAFFGSDVQPTPTGHLRVRSVKFPLSATSTPAKELKRLWSHQSEYEEQVARLLDPPPQACLAWGWAEPEAGGRWCFRTAGLHVPDSGRLTLRGRALAPLWLQIFSSDGRRLHEVEVGHEVDVGCDVPPGFISLRFSMRDVATPDDPRPLALFVSGLTVRGRSLLDDRISEIWADSNNAHDRMATLAEARVRVRDPHALTLSPLRSSSKQLDEYVRDQVADYDLMITHNAVFESTTAAISAAEAAQVPSILIPHLHYDDDFYHFGDVVSACASASRTLVCPLSVKHMLVEEGLDNVVYHSPGVDASTTFTDDDVKAFRNVALGIDNFFLVLGRKAAAKGYQDIIEALDAVSDDHAPVIVMIGPDDDGIAIEDPRVNYLGRQSDAVVRGALRECLALINMSRSESFGMVLLEAGLAGKPVLANCNCAAFADIVEDGVNGFLTSRNDLSARMFDLQSDPVLCRSLGEEGRKLALKYDWEKVEKEFVRICDNLVKKNNELR